MVAKIKAQSERIVQLETQFSSYQASSDQSDAIKSLQETLDQKNARINELEGEVSNLTSLKDKNAAEIRILNKSKQELYQQL